MSYYSDPTAARALGSINREFSRKEKRAKAIIKLFKEGKITIEDLEKAHSEFSGIYSHVLEFAIAKLDEDENEE